jgi:uncharacterized RDD family membrane protein YckC
VVTEPPPADRAPAGWYADLSAPGRLRYWDGTAWSGVTIPPPGQPPGWYPDPLRSDLIRYWDGAGWVGPPQAYPPNYVPAPRPKGSGLMTEAGDWFELSGWWRRFAGYVLDIFIVGIPFAAFEIVVGLIFYSEPYGVVSLGRAHPAIAGAGPRIALELLSMALTFFYAVWLIGSRRQTFGMRAVGITAIDPSGRALTSYQVWMRALYRVLFIGIWTFVVSSAALIGTTDGRPHESLTLFNAVLTGALSLLVYLWALGNDRNQTLIDLAAGSVVVRGDHLGAAASIPPTV